jgi:hypothetical protein
MSLGQLLPGVKVGSSTRSARTLPADHRPVDRVYPLRISAGYWPGWPVRVIRAKAGLSWLFQMS